VILRRKNLDSAVNIITQSSVIDTKYEELRILFDSLDEAIKSVFKGTTVSDETNDLEFLLHDSKDKNQLACYSCE